MASNIIPGKKIAEELQDGIAKLTQEFKQRTGKTPKLCIVQVGNDEPSSVYIRNKLIALKKLAMEGNHLHLPADISQDALQEKINALNNDPTVCGIIVQLPLPSHIDKQHILNIIRPEKDVDGLTVVNQGLLFNGDYRGLIPCTPLGCFYLLNRFDALAPGALAVVIGRSNLVGKPIATLLLNAQCTTICTHSKTKNLDRFTSQADIIVAAAGCAHMIKKSMVKPGAYLMDVGLSRTPEGLLSGDIDFQSVHQEAKAITPVPGGIGPMTVTMLMLNTLQAAYNEAGIRTSLYKTFLGLFK